MPSPPDPHGSGIVAIGDSLLDTDRSWASWLSRAMGLPLRTVAVGGSLSRDVVDQLPSLSGGRYALACVSVGVNDVLFDWDPDRYATHLGTIVAAAGAAADRVVVPTITVALAGFPGSAADFRRRVRQANRLIARADAEVLDGSDLRGPRLMMADRIHPTEAGQLVLADRAAALLGVRPLPSSLDDEVRPTAWKEYYSVAAGQVPRRIVKRALGRPHYARRDPTP